MAEDTGKRKIDNVHAAEEFLTVVVSGHILAATMKHFNMADTKSTPDTSLIPEDIHHRKDG